MNEFIPAIFYLGALLLSPLFLGIIPRVKAKFAGRQGQPLLQVYYDLARLLRKGAVYSTTTTWLFRFGPMLGLSAVLAAMVMVPMFGFPALISFPGDILVFIYLLALVRFFTVIAAMDTGSSFEGMGASREVIFSMLTEPILFLAVATLVKHSGSLCLGEVFNPSLSGHIYGPSLALATVSLFVVVLVENYRVPIDDPTTHLELTMIHEVMVLDNSGPDFAFVLYASCLKLWMMTGLLAQLVVPAFPDGPIWTRPAVVFGTMVATAVVIGIVESTMARLRLVKIPQLLMGVSILALVGFILGR